MHIIYLHQHFVLRTGASGVRSYEFSRLLVERGHSITLITGYHELSGLPRPRKLIEKTIVDGIEIRMVRSPYSQKMGFWRRLYAFFHFMVFSIFAGLKIKNVDLVFATSTPLTIAIPGIVLSFIHRCPFVFEVRDVWPDVPIEMGILKNRVLIRCAKLLERIAYMRARHIVALSPGMKELIVKKGVTDKKVTVIPNASDVNLFRVPPDELDRFRKELAWLDDRPLVLYAGAFGKVNGLDYVIALAREVYQLDPSIVFLLLGDGSEKDKLVRLSKSFGVYEKNVFFHPPVARERLPYYIGIATIVSSFTIPVDILKHNSANKFFDAFAGGKPICINYEGWQAELLRETGAGIVLDPHDPQSSGRLLVDRIHDKEWLERAARASRELGEKVFHRNILVRQLEQVFFNVAEI